MHITDLLADSAEMRRQFKGNVRCARDTLDASLLRLVLRTCDTRDAGCRIIECRHCCRSLKSASAWQNVCRQSVPLSARSSVCLLAQSEVTPRIFLHTSRNCDDGDNCVLEAYPTRRS